MSDDSRRDQLSEISTQLRLATSEMEAIRGHVERVERDVTLIKHKVIGGGDERPLQIRVEDAERELKTLKDRDESQRVDRRAASADLMQWVVGIIIAAILGAAATALIMSSITG